MRTRVPRGRKFEVDPVEYPFADNWLNRGGSALHYVDEGTGSPVPRLHGNPGMVVFSLIMGGPIGKYLHLRRNFFARKIVPSGIASAARRTPAILKAYTDPFPTPASRTGTWVFPRAIRGSAGWLAEIEQRLPRLSAKPVEFVWAMKDVAFGHERILRRWSSYFPEAPVDRLEEAKHYLQEDEPDRVAAAVKRVLARSERRRA